MNNVIQIISGQAFTFFSKSLPNDIIFGVKTGVTLYRYTI